MKQNKIINYNKKQKKIVKKYLFKYFNISNINPKFKLF